MGARFLQVFEADDIEKDVYRLNKPYFDIISSLEREGSGFLHEVDENLR